jgi:2-polyprenyl-3-methyl-5-hydroxy-6-metoxy-1,4-benzoquinol methylase
MKRSMNATTGAPICTIPCNLCGGVDVTLLADTDRDGQPLQTVICRGCGLAWTDPRPSAGEQRSFYADEYRQQYKAARQPKLKHVHREMLRAMHRYTRIAPLLQPGMRLLDIGAGAGFFPYVARHHGMEVTGLEPHAGYAAYGRDEFQLDIKTGFLQEAEYAPGEFDLITLNHVLEHLEDPLAALTRMRAWLKPGGFLNLEVPNIESGLHAPSHMFHRAHLYSFNPDNLQRLARRAGYHVVDERIMPGTGHINLLLQTTAAQAMDAGPFHIPGNYDRIRGVLDARTTMSHYLSVRPYLRFLRKLAGYAREQLAVRRFRSGRELADYLLAAGGDKRWNK